MDKVLYTINKKDYSTNKLLSIIEEEQKEDYELFSVIPYENKEENIEPFIEILFIKKHANKE